MARISRNGEKYQENFTLNEYRTWKAAQAAADKWVRKMKRELPAQKPAKGRMSRRNESGVVGVRAFVDKSKGHHYCRWYAKWPGCPNAGGVSFSADILGDNEAFLCAYLARTHETVDREWVMKKLKTFQKTKKSKEILKLKQVKFA